VIDGTLTLGQFTAFYAYLLMLISPMRTLGYLLGAAQRATASGARIFQILDRAPGIVAPPNAPPLPEGTGAVSLRGVGLTFPGSPQPALSDIDLEVRGGETVALVGAMGSGKTALVSLLSRLYDVSTGSVSIDGADVRSVDLMSLRRSIAVVTDDPFLFSATVHDNIAYGRGGRDPVSREEVQRAAAAAQADRFIEQLPDGYDTRVGERGMTLSGGQRQRIAIARAIVAGGGQGRILILDDATSSVDASTESEIKAALSEVMAGRTTFVIAHRLSTIALADRIFVLESGRLVDSGTHDELLETSDLYREIVEKGMPDQVFGELAGASSTGGYAGANPPERDGL
jgi:ATP-binding cassette subfamily B protein